MVRFPFFRSTMVADQCPREAKIYKTHLSTFSFKFETYTQDMVYEFLVGWIILLRKAMNQQNFIMITSLLKLSSKGKIINQQVYLFSSHKIIFLNLLIKTSKIVLI